MKDVFFLIATPANEYLPKLLIDLTLSITVDREQRLKNKTIKTKPKDGQHSATNSKDDPGKATSSEPQTSHGIIGGNIFTCLCISNFG